MQKMDRNVQCKKLGGVTRQWCQWARDQQNEKDQEKGLWCGTPAGILGNVEKASCQEDLRLFDV